MSVIAAVLMAGAVPAQVASKMVTIEIGDWWCVNGGQRQGSVAKNLTDVVPGNSPAGQWQSGRTATRSIIYSPTGSRVEVRATIHCKTWAFDPGYYRYVIAVRWVDRNDNVSWWVV